MTQGKPWTAEEDQKLIEMAQKGVPNGEIAQELPDRTVAAVRCRRPKLAEQIRDPASGLTQAQMEEAVFQYTYAGMGRTAQQVANSLGVPVQALKAEFRARDITKHSPPKLPENIPADKDKQEELAREVSAKRSAEFLRTLDEVDVKKLRRENQKLQKKLDEKEYVVRLFDERLEDFEPETPQPLTRIMNAAGDPATFVMPTADPHFGKRVWGRESFGDNYDTKIAEERFKDVADWMADRIANSLYKCETLYLPSLGDDFHAPLLQTEHGTDLERDGRDLYVVEAYMRARHYQIARAREVCDDVRVYGVPGNHGHLIEQLALRELAAYYRNADDVEVYADVTRYNYFQVGETGFLLDHGYGINKLDTPSTREKLNNTLKGAMGDDYYDCRYFYILMGHRHTDDRAEYGSSATAMRFRALCEVDAFETERRYDGEAGATLLRLSERGRVTGTESIIF